MSTITTDTPTAPLVPHLAFPFVMATQANGVLGANVNEQDSLDDVFACVQAIVACPLGAWIDQPGFGIPVQTFSQTPVSTTGLQNSVARLEPRAVLTLREYPNAINDAYRNVQISVSATQPDQ